MKKNHEKDAFYSGVLVSLAVVYAFDQETVASEIVNACEPYALLRVAKEIGDPYVARLRRTVRALNDRGKR